MRVSMRDVAQLGALAQMQWGLVTTRQADTVGVPRMRLSRMAAAGVLERVAQGVYRMTGVPAHEHEEILAAWLAVDDRARDRRGTVVISGAAAARLHGIGDLSVSTVDLVVTHRRTSRNPAVRTHVEHLPPADVTLVDGAPVVTPMRCLADLVRDWVDLSLIADALRDAEARGIADLGDLARRLDPLAARDGHDSGASFVAALAADAGLDRAVAA